MEGHRGSLVTSPLAVAEMDHLVVLAQRLRTVEIATLDERHFRVLKPLTGEPAYRLLSADRDPT